MNILNQSIQIQLDPSLTMSNDPLRSPKIGVLGVRPHPQHPNFRLFFSNVTLSS